MQNILKKRVCIIGAGPRGLVTARHLAQVADLDVVVFDAQKEVGGQWFYEDKNGADPQFDPCKQYDNFYKLHHCFQGSMYKHLITNLPYFFMEFKDLPMREVIPDIPMFISVQQYKTYLDAFKEHFQLQNFIRLNTLVKSVRLYDNISEEEKQRFETNRKFVVKTVAAEGESLDSDLQYHDFDYIVVAGGQYSLPYYPEIQNIDKFEGNTLHCKDFRTPNHPYFQGKRVLVIGGGASAQEMLIQFFSDEVERSIECSKLIFCSRNVDLYGKSEDFQPFVKEGRLSTHSGHVVDIKKGNIVCFSDGEEEEIDTIIYATGYKLTFPYFDLEKDKIIDHDLEKHRGNFFGPTYKKFIAIREPSVFFIGFLEMTSVIHIHSELQAMVLKHIIEGTLTVPPGEEMMKDWEDEVEYHLKHVGDLAHFYKTNLVGSYPEMTRSQEHVEWAIFSNWLKPVHKNNDEEKAQLFWRAANQTKVVIFKLRKEGNLLQYKKFDYFTIFPKDFKNTTEFV